MEKKIKPTTGTIRIRMPMRRKAELLNLAKKSGMALGRWIEYVLDTVIDEHKKSKK